MGGEIKIYANEFGPMTNMATILIHGKTPLKYSSPEPDGTIDK